MGASDLSPSCAFGDSWEGRVHWGSESPLASKSPLGFSSLPVPLTVDWWCRTQPRLGVTAPMRDSQSRGRVGFGSRAADESGVDWCNSTLAN